MVTEYTIALAAFIILARCAELCLAKRNRTAMLAAGAIEFGRSHYPLFFILHACWLMGWVVESLIRDSPSNYWYVWGTVFVAAQFLRYWCIASLGRNWNTRILVIPGERAVRLGPYCYISHPNYIAVCLEIISIPLIFNAWITAGVVTLANAGLLLGVRIPVEEKALELLKQ